LALASFGSYVHYGEVCWLIVKRTFGITRDLSCRTMAQSVKTQTGFRFSAF
jgi:hypothetical protein